MNIDDLSREEKVLLFVLGTIKGLVEKGLMTGPCPLTKTGSKKFAELQSSDFEPTKKEMNYAMKALRAIGYLE